MCGNHNHSMFSYTSFFSAISCSFLFCFFFILLLFFCLFKLDLNFSVVKLIVSNLGEMTAHGIILAISTIILALLLLLLL